MTRRVFAGCLVGASLALASHAVAQEVGKVPITRDLQRNEINKERLEMLGRPVEGEPPTRLPPGAQSDPSGVAGFNGPPGTVGDSVGSYGALPQGISGSDIR